jgi:N-acetylglucosamine-6-phosphate deacetylase
VPDTLNEPGTNFYKRGTIGLDLPLYEGGAGTEGAKGAEKIALVTDSMRGAGMPEGKSILGSRAKGREVLIEDGVAKMPDRQSFAGSVATADRLVRNMYRMGERPLEEAVRMMTLTPAEIMGIADRKGKIAKGYDADIVIFDPDIRINRVFINGETLFEQP